MYSVQIENSKKQETKYSHLRISRPSTSCARRNALALRENTNVVCLPPQPFLHVPNELNMLVITVKVIPPG